MLRQTRLMNIGFHTLLKDRDCHFTVDHYGNSTIILGVVEKVKNAYVDLTPYLENDPDFYNAIPESLWTGVSLNGGIYGVPTYKELGEQWALTVDKEVLEKTGIDYTTIHTWADAEPLLAAMKEQGLGAMYVANYTEALKVGLFNTFDFTPYNLGVIRRATGEKIENLYTCCSTHSEQRLMLH